MADKRTSEFVAEFSDLARQAVNEEELRLAFVAAAVSKLGLRDLKMERGRQDVRRQHVVIEFKAKGLFNGSKASAKFGEAAKQLVERYIPAQAALDGADPSDYVGVCFDGVHLAFAFVEANGAVRITDLQRFDDQSAAALVLALDHDQRVELTSDNVAADFGPSSPVARDMLQALWLHLDASLSQPVVTRTQMLFEEWTDLFQQSTGLGTLGASELNEYLHVIGIPPGADLTRVLFVLHTYHALFFKLLAAELVLTNSIFLGAPAGYCFAASGLDDAALLDSLGHDIEDSQLFRRVNIVDFAEGSFFAWYLNGSPPASLADGVRVLLRRLGLYRLSGLNLARSRDIVKRIYQELVPRTLRRNIGEFFTPEWLVEFTLNRVGYRGPAILDGKYLDPCCGSGTFLIHAIDRFKAEARAAGWADDAILGGILDRITGFDLNPLAVLTSRVNYLIAIADLIASHSEVEIPVFHADAVYAPTIDTQPGGVPIRTYRIATRIDTIEIRLPEDLIQRGRLFARIMGAMERAIQQRGTEAELHASLAIEPDYAADPQRAIWEPFLLDMFRKVDMLERQDWNRLWCRIVRNYFASVAIGRCNFIAGNPPWVRWSSLPPRYAELIKPTCDSYGIFSIHKYHGGNELDLSGIITYTVADKWLADSGRLAFIVTQTHFQSQSSGGFRRFEVKGTPLRVEQVDDLAKVRPWPDLGNKPAVLTVEKGRQTTYPVPYVEWTRSGGSVPEDASLATADPRLHPTTREANPLSGPGQRWSLLPPGRFPRLNALDGADPQRVGRKGVTTDLNGAYFVDLVGPGRGSGSVRFRNRPQEGKHLVPAYTGEIEVELIFPLLKGAGSIRAFRATHGASFVVVPNRGITPTQVGTAAAFGQRYPRALQYFRSINANGMLDRRSTWRNYMLPNYEQLVAAGSWQTGDVPNYAIYNVGAYTFSPFKVVWAEIAGSLEAAVISEAPVPFGGGLKPIVPDHKVYFVPFDDADHAHYVCALLNAQPVREFVDSFTVKLQVGSLFRHVRLPEFDPNKPSHLALVAHSRRAHELRDEDPVANAEVERDAIDQLALAILNKTSVTV